MKGKKTKRSQDYTKTIKIGAECGKVYSALATLKGLRGWWTPLVNGKPTTGGKVRFEFEGLEEYIDMKVERSSDPSAVHWTCLKHTDLPEWDGTKIEFNVTRKSANSCILNFRHIGLSPKLDCFNDCKLGWDHFLASIVALVENGKGMPFGG